MSCTIDPQMMGDWCDECARDPYLLDPTRYPFSTRVDGSTALAHYRCECGHSWQCWWGLDYVTSVVA